MRNCIINEEPKSRNLTSKNWDQKSEMSLDWPHPAQRWRQYSKHGDGVESAWWFRKSFSWTVPGLEKSSWARDKNAWEKLARAEINSQKPHTIASSLCWCSMSQIVLRIRRRRQLPVGSDMVVTTNSYSRKRPRQLHRCLTVSVPQRHGRL